MLTWKNKNKGPTSNDYDVEAMRLFDDVVGATLGVYNNPVLARANPSPTGRLRTLAKSWAVLLGKVASNLPPKVQLKSGKLPSVSAIVMRSYMVPLDTGKCVDRKSPYLT